MFLRSAKFIVSPASLLRLLLVVLVGLTAATAFPRAGHAAALQGDTVASVAMQPSAASDTPTAPLQDEAVDDGLSLGDDHADEVLILPLDAVELQRMVGTRPAGVDFISIDAPLDDEPRPPDLG